MSIERSLRQRSLYLEAMMGRLEDMCQSPIERRLGCALLGTKLAALAFVAVGNDDGKDPHHGFYIIPQRPIRNYRADFALALHDITGVYRLAVECDGHEFHEKSKEQAAHDKARDRAFLEEGWPVMRFTGSEIHQDPDKCADQVSDFLYHQLVKAHGLEPERAN